MKTSKLLSLTAVLTVLSVIATAALGSPNDRNAAQSDEGYAYVFVTGSRIPQKVKIKSVGTTTVSALRVYKRREIDQTGRFTTAGVLATDPSLQVVAGSPGGTR